MSNNGTFKTAEDVELRPNFSTPVVMTASRDLNISINKLLNGGLRIDEILNVLWYACESQCKKKEITQEEFFDKHLTPATIPAAVKAFFFQLGEAFPQLKDLGGEGGSDNPLVLALSQLTAKLGRSGQLSNSPDSAESIPSKPE